jgi:hypothetical protein
MTLVAFRTLYNRVAEWNLPVSAAVLSLKVLLNLLTNEDIISYAQTATMDIGTGYIGTIFGVPVFTYGDEEGLSKVSDVYVVTSPKHLGVRVEDTERVTKPNKLPIPMSEWIFSNCVRVAVINQKGITIGRMTR